jgi:integrase
MVFLLRPVSLTSWRRETPFSSTFRRTIVHCATSRYMSGLARLASEQASLRVDARSVRSQRLYVSKARQAEAIVRVSTSTSVGNLRRGILGLPAVTPHSARHSFISVLQAQGVEVGLVAKLAGHKSAVVTLSHYTHAMRGGEDAVKALDRAYAGSAP